jgi:hypothetical protein
MPSDSLLLASQALSLDHWWLRQRVNCYLESASATLYILRPNLPKIMVFSSIVVINPKLVSVDFSGQSRIWTTDSSVAAF